MRHKKHCVKPEERTPQAMSAGKTLMEGAGLGDECPIFLEPLTRGAACNLPCSHTFHPG